MNYHAVAPAKKTSKNWAMPVVVFLLLAVLALGCVDLSVPAATVVVDSAYVRSGPGKSFSVVNGAQYGCPVWVHGESLADDGTWYNISAFCANGWIRGDLLSDVAGNVPVADSPPTPIPEQLEKVEKIKEIIAESNGTHNVVDGKQANLDHKEKNEETNKIVTLEQAMQYCGLSEYNHSNKVIFIDSLRAADPGFNTSCASPESIISCTSSEVFKAFGDLPECDPTQGVDAEAWDAIKDAVKDAVKEQLLLPRQGEKQ